MDKIKNVPMLRFPEFIEEWICQSYGDKYSFFTTNSLSREKLNYKGGVVKNIHYGDIHTKFATLFNIEKENVPYINEEVDLSRIKKDSYCLQGDLIIADASEDYDDIGKTIELINTNNEKLLAGLHTFLARPKGEKLILGFMSYLLQSWKPRKQIMTIAQGSKVLSLSTKRLSNIGLDIPHPKEQTKIAEFLSEVDKKIELLTKKKQGLENYKKGIMQKIFNQEIRFKDDNGNDYPDWEEKKLGDIGETYNGLTGKTKINFGEGNPYIQYKQVFNNLSIDEKQYGFVKIEINEKQNQVQYGDILFTTSSETPIDSGMSSVFLNNQEGVYLNSFCFGFRPNSILEVVPEFAKYLFRNDSIRRDIVKLAQGSTRYNISKVQMMKISLKLPKKEEQEVIGKFITDIENKIIGADEEISNFQKFKKGLLQQMFV